MIETVRAKFAVTKVAELGDYNGGRVEVTRCVSAPGDVVRRYEKTGVPVREITMAAVYGGSAENNSFAEATPSGEIKFTVNNPAVQDHFKPGDSYYVEFKKAE